MHFFLLLIVISYLYNYRKPFLFNNIDVDFVMVQFLNITENCNVIITGCFSPRIRMGHALGWVQSVRWETHIKSVRKSPKIGHKGLCK